MRYFAYGSNLCVRRLRRRVPSARALGPARLDGWTLRWHKRGEDGSGKCSIARPDAGSSAGRRRVENVLPPEAPPDGGPGRVHAHPFGTDPDPRATVLGALFEVPPSEKPRLDRAESLGTGYREALVDVFTANGIETAFTYIASGAYRDERMLPYAWYKDIVIAGARTHGFPDSYLEALAAVRAAADPDRARARFHRADLPCRGGG